MAAVAVAKERVIFASQPGVAETENKKPADGGLS
jgi:hypothetical protein